MDVRYHPLFDRWFAELAQGDEEVFGDVMALLSALEDHGRALDDERREESHPVVTSRYDLHALRRTPPTQSTPYATQPPVLRVLYGYCRAADRSDVAVALLGGDKSTLGNLWYSANINEAKARLEQYCRRYSGLTPDSEERQSMTKRIVPVDNVTAKTSRISDEDWKRAEGAQQRYKDLLETKPRAKARYDAVLAEINARQATLRRLREARELTQSTVADLLEMDQSEVSRLERRSDMLLSTLKRFVEASGGELHLIVQFPESGPVELLVGED